MNALNLQVSEALLEQSSELAAQMVNREFSRHPDLEKRFGRAGREKCLQDAGYHLAYLAQSISAGSTELFSNYIGWAKVMLVKRGVSVSDLAGLLETMKELLGQEFPPDWSKLACTYIEAALRQLPEKPQDLAPCIVPGTLLAPLARDYLGTLLRGERQSACKLILDAVGQGVTVRDLYLQVFQRSQHEIGRLWQVNEISVAQEHYCTAATQLIMAQLYPQVFASKKIHGTLVGTCVSGDLHEMGVRMVCDFFEMEGWNTHYLGANVPTASVVQTVVQLRARVLAISATITYHIRTVEALIASVRRVPECQGVKIIVGGYPFQIAPDLWRNIGADGSANDAQEAIALAHRLGVQSLAA